MRLEVGSVIVQDVVFGSRTSLEGRTLVVDREEIRNLILEDPHFSDVELHVARPGESTRIIHALDIVEPRWKVAGPGGVFPGFVSPPTTVGEGQTNRLAGVAVIEVGEPVPGEATHFREQIIDMSGPGSEYSPFGQTLNLVLHFKPNLSYFAGVDSHVKNVVSGAPEAIEYNDAMTRAGVKVAARLGRTSQEAEPDHREVFELPKLDSDLVKVVCMYQYQRPYGYGVRLAQPLGALIHPNECFDGAFVGWHQNYRCTYWDQNNQAMIELCRRHGRDLNFLGCVLFGHVSPDRSEKERIASAATKLARLLGAEAALILGINGSNQAVDLMLTVRDCEQAGIKTTLLYQDVGSGNDDPGFIFSLPEADAIVCTGSRDYVTTLPRMENVIGGDHLVNPDIDASGEINVPLRYLHSSSGVQGYNRLTTRFE